MSIVDSASNSATLSVGAQARPRRRGFLSARGWATLAPVADALVLTLAVAVERLSSHSAGTSGLATAWLIGFPVIAITLLATGGLYRYRLRLSAFDDLRTIAGATAIAAMATITLPVLFGDGTNGLAAQGVRLWLFSTVYLTASRAGIISSIVSARVSGAAPAPTLIVGAGSVGRLLAKRFQEHREIGLQPIGFLDKDPLDAEDAKGAAAGLPVLGASWDLADVIERHGIEHVVFTFSTAPHSVMLRMIDECEQMGVRVTVVPRLFERLPNDLTIDYLGGIPLVSIHASSPTSFGMRAKYVVDRILAALLLLILLPALAIISATIWLTLGRPIFFRQARVGRDGRIFTMLKFRTMRALQYQADVTDNKVEFDVAPGGVEGEDRRTRFGLFLRRSSLDELPQLVNVLRGEMSLVGPRPERPEYVDAFKDFVYRYDDRHRVKSGITGWAQINGLRGKTSLADRVEWDNWYIENWSGALDMKILLNTALAVVRNAKIVE